MGKDYFSRIWKQKSAEWISKAITDLENFHRIDTNYLNGEIEFFFKKFSYEDTLEGQWYRENIYTDDAKNAKFETIASNAKITVGKVSFLPTSLKYSLGLLTGIIVFVITKCLDVTIFRSLLIGVFAGIIVYYFAGNFQNRANKRKVQTLTDNVKQQLDEICTNLKLT